MHGYYYFWLFERGREQREEKRERETEQWHSSCIFSLVRILITYLVCIVHTVNVCNLLCCHQYLLSSSFLCVINSETIKYTASNSIGRVCVCGWSTVPKSMETNKRNISQRIAETWHLFFCILLEHFQGFFSVASAFKRISFDWIKDHISFGYASLCVVWIFVTFFQ